MAQSIREKARIRQGREEGRLTEDEIARARLGGPGGLGTADPDRMTEDERKQTPSALDPGHTA